jgi:hypothetical protein
MGVSKMNTITFWTAITVALLITLGSVIIISSSGSSEKAGESRQEGYLVFETMEINVPVQHFDFTDEAPMLITANDTGTTE